MFAGVSSVSFQSWQPQLSELPKTWKTLCFPPTIGADHRSFQSYLKPERLYASHQLSELTTVAFRATIILSTVTVENCNFQNYMKKYYQLIVWFLIAVFIVFAVSYTEPVEITWTKTLHNLYCQIEESFIVESFLIEKTWNFQQIYVRSLELLNYSIILLATLS